LHLLFKKPTIFSRPSRIWKPRAFGQSHLLPSAVTVASRATLTAHRLRAFRQSILKKTMVVQTGSTGVDPGVEFDRGLDALVAEELPDDLIRSGVAVEDHLSSKVPEGMRIELDADMALDGPLDQNAHARC